MVAPPTRRSFLRGAGAAALPALGLLAGCGGDGPASDEERRRGTTPTVVSDAGGDADLLNSALAAEHLEIAAFTAGMPLLTAISAEAAGRHLLTQEREHAARLRALIAQAGGSPVGPLSSYDFDSPGNEREMLRVLQRVERRTVAVYAGVVPRLVDARLRAAAASIAVAEAEHDALLRLLLGRWPAPTAFVTGGA